MANDDTPGTGWDEEWEIVDLDEPARRVSAVVSIDRLSQALVRGMTGLSFGLLWVALMLDKLSGAEFSACFIALTAAAGGAKALIKRPEYLQQLGRVGRAMARAVSTIDGRAVASKHDSETLVPGEEAGDSGGEESGGTESNEGDLPDDVDHTS